MSQVITVGEKNHGGASSNDSLLDILPADCKIPGYWDTLEINTLDWAPNASVSPFWRQANSNLEVWKKEYRREFGGALFKGAKLNDFVGKSGERIKEKIPSTQYRGFSPNSFGDAIP